MLKNDLVLRAARGEATPRTPVWLMRQAGRSDPDYRALRDRVGLPLEELFARPDLATEISLQPQRIGVDAIIMFQDILTPLAPMGARFVFRPGPVLEQPIRNVADLERLHTYDPRTELAYVADTLRLIRKSLNGALPVLGFAGAPLTLAMFLLEGKSPGDRPEHARAFLRGEPARFRELLAQLTDVTVEYLSLQIDAGADAIQLFESAAHLLTREEFVTWALPFEREVFARLGRRVPGILFVRDQPFVDLMAAAGADVLSVTTSVDLSAAKQEFPQLAFQGNVSNELLARGSLEEIDAAVGECIRAGGQAGHILNLGHGVLPETPFENVRRFVEVCHSTVLDP